MSQENVELVWRAMEWWGRAQGDRVPEDIFDPDIEIRGRLSAVAGEPYRGLAGVEEWIDDIWQAGLHAEFRAGRILRLTIYGSPAEALKAVRLEE